MTLCTTPNLPDPLLRVVSADGKIIDLLGDGGWKISDPYWHPQIARYKNDGHYVDSAMADDTRLVFKKYAPVVETIPLSVRGKDQPASIRTIRELLQLGRQSSDYWTESYEFDNVWLECRPAHPNCRTGYARIKKMQVPELSDPFGQPFFSYYPESVMEDISLIIEREPLWRGVAPGSLIGPLYNLIKNPDFELWNFGVTDSQPDSWDDLETIQITGSNNREDSTFHSGNYSLRVRVGGSTLAGRMKGVSQTISGIRANTQYTVVCWVRNDGVGNGVGRILVTYSSQLEVYRESAKHDWTLYTGTFTTGVTDTVAISCEILTTSAGTDGTVYFDSLMILEGDWEEEAIDEFLPYLSSSHIVNHWDQPGGALIEAGDINYVDVWEVPGDNDALVRLEVQNNTTPADLSDPVELFATVRVGMRRTKDVFLFDNYNDPTGLTDTTASSNDRIESDNLSNAWVDLTSKIVSSNTIHNEGRYRVLARVFDNAGSGNPTLMLRLKYFIGAAGIGEKTLDSVTAPVRQQWFIAGLTPNAAMVMDSKFSTDAPSQLGYGVQVSRSIGTSKGYLDYVLTMPTDGGYLEASLDPPLTEGNALIVDNTASQSISATQRRAGWVAIFELTLAVADIASFGGAVFLGIGDGSVYRYFQGDWTIVFTHATSECSVEGMETFNGELYLASIDTGVSFVTTIYKTNNNGASWSLVVTLSLLQFEPTILKSFAGTLFIAGSDNVNVRVYRWDGTSATLSFMSPVLTNADAKSMATYAGKLYLIVITTSPGAGVTTIYAFDPTTGIWTLSTTVSNTQLDTLIEFNGKLYAIGGSAIIRAFDGTSWATVVDLTSEGVLEFTAIAVYNNKLFVGGTNTAATRAIVFQSSDGEDFELAYSSPAAAGSGTNTVTNMGVSNGVLYMSVRFFGGGGGTTILALAEDDLFYKVADYQGTPFTSPPVKRHRFFFSYDREGFINNADDAALIGIGFVPRFLSLIGQS